MEIQALPKQGDPMILATYAGDPEGVKTCRKLGPSIFQTDSDHLSTNQAAYLKVTAKRHWRLDFKGSG